MAIALLEAIIFSDGNEIVLSFFESGILFKCEGGLFRVIQNLANKNNNMNFRIIVLILDLTFTFNIFS
jgi:hypothetical protein